VVFPLIAVNLLVAYGVGVVAALAYSAIFPAIETTIAAIRLHHVDALGAISLTFIALGIGASLVSGDVHFALAKESFFSGVFGLICLVSLALPRPLIFYISRTFAAGGDHAREAAWNGRWVYPMFRQVMRTMTLVWGVGYLLEAALRVILVYVLPVRTAINVSPLLAAGTTVALIVWTLRYGKAAQRRADERFAREAAV